MREQLSAQFFTHWRKFRGDKEFHRALETADGIPIACYQGGRDELLGRICGSLYDARVDF